jgi:hypothetical protein
MRNDVPLKVGADNPEAAFGQPPSGCASAWMFVAVVQPID